MSFSRRRSSVADAAQVLHHDEDKLAELGYKQELNRSWSLLHNFGVSFSIIVSQASLQNYLHFRHQHLSSTILCNANFLLAL